MPDPVIDPPDGIDPEHQALIADSVGLALLVVLETLKPAERLAFVLHDVFAVPFDEIAPMVERTPEATRQLASRGRRRVRNADVAPAPETSIGATARVVDAFFAAGRAGNFEALVAVLHPDVVLRADFGPQRARVLKGAEDVADQALLFCNVGRDPRPATINGVAGVVVFANGRPVAVMGFTVTGGKIAAIDVLSDPKRVANLDLSAVDT
jgi:RNA polymerase sigma-70 factor (ECF subfamily)